MDYFSSLPLEIQLDIFSRVPAESLLNDTQLVCKTWNDLVHHPSLPRLHLHRVNHGDPGKLGFLASTRYLGSQKFKYFEYNQNHESTTPIERLRRVNLKTPFYLTKIVGSCNGLVCLDGYQSLCICNPINKEQVMLPEIRLLDTRKGFKLTSGFGYVSSTNEYKIVAIRKYYSLPQFPQVYIYTVGGGTGWRNLGKFDIDFGLDRNLKGVFVNGNLYWIGQNPEMVIIFDLAEEKFREQLLTPPMASNGNPSLNRIGVLDGFLYCAVWLKEGYPNDIWLLENKKNGMKNREDHHSLCWSWTKKFKLQDRRLVAVTKNGGLLTHNCDDYLNIYDPKTCISKELVDFKDFVRQIIPHTNTLVSLKQLGEKGTEIMESIEPEQKESCDSPKEQLESMESTDA